MLVLSRMKDEEIVITAPDGSRISIKVVEILQNKIRIGIDAATNIKVHRKEVQDKIDAET